MGRFMQRSVLLPPSCRGCSHPQVRLEGLLAGLLGGLSASNLVSDEHKHCHGLSMFEPSLRFTAFKQPWCHGLDMDGFTPGEINLNVDGNVVYVHARHEDVDGGNIDIIERKRVVEIPKCVDVQQLACFIDRSGRMIFKAPFLHRYFTKKDEEKRSDKRKENEITTDLKTDENLEPETNDAHDLHDVDNDSMKCFELSDKETNADSVEKKTVNQDTEYECKQSNVKCDSFSSTNEIKEESDTSVNEDKSRCDSPIRVEKECDASLDSLQKEAETSTDMFDVIEKNGQKYFSVKLDVGPFLVDSIRVRCQDKVLSVDAKRELEDAGKTEMQEFHRQFKLPDNAFDEQARAFVTDSGYFAVDIPIKDENTLGITA